MDYHFTYKYDDLFNPTLQALKRLGGSGSVSEIEEAVIQVLGISNEAANEIQSGNRTKLSYRLAWTRTYLKNHGVIANSSRGVWALTEMGKAVEEVNKIEVNRTTTKLVRKHKKQGNEDNPQESAVPADEEDSQESRWQERLINTITASISPSQFERLCRRLLRELGFVEVEVTQQSNDGGIDGKGIIKIGGVLSFHVVFQAKRHQGSVSTSVVRDFRGAMVGRADKGLIISTGNFTREARSEALRDGATPIDLIGGNDFAEKLKELKLGIAVEMVEQVKIDEEWFRKL
jgi:restriction system protein